MISTSLKALGLSSAVLVAASFAVFAQTAPQPDTGTQAAKGNRPMAACRADMKALCGGVERKGGGRMKCLVENKDKASAECQAVMAAMQQRMGKGANKEARKAARQACQPDIQSLCSTAEKGRGGIMRCLRENETKVSPACAQALAGLPMRKGRMMGGQGTMAPPPAPAAPKPQ